MVKRGGTQVGAATSPRTRTRCKPRGLRARGRRPRGLLRRGRQPRREHDPKGEYFANTVAEVRPSAQERRITVFDTDVTTATTWRTKLLSRCSTIWRPRWPGWTGPTSSWSLQEAGETAAEVVRFADDWPPRPASSWRTLPNQEYELRRLARNCSTTSATTCTPCVDAVRRARGVGTPTNRCTRGITQPYGTRTSWVDSGLGTGSPDAWFAQIEGPWVVGCWEATQDEYYRAKTKITQVLRRCGRLARGVHPRSCGTRWRTSCERI